MRTRWLLPLLLALALGGVAATSASAQPNHLLPLPSSLTPANPQRFAVHPAAQSSPRRTVPSSSTVDGVWSDDLIQRYQHTAIYDPVGNRMIVFGGYDGADRNDVWALSLDSACRWDALSPQGTPPSARNAHTAIYDPVRHRMIIFGGGQYLNDTWALSLGGTPTWAQLSPLGVPPSGRLFHTAIYDPVGDRMVVFGGEQSGGALCDDVWALSLSSAPEWTQLQPNGDAPTPRAFHSAIYDPIRQRMIVQAGSAGPGGPDILSDTWALSLTGVPTWTLLYSVFMTAGHRAVYDAVRDRMLVYGGHGWSDGAGWIPHYDVVALALEGAPSWTTISTSGSRPDAREGHTVIYDPFGDRLIVLGGWVCPQAEVWQLTLSGTPSWQKLLPSAPAPQPRECHTAVYDSNRDRMLIFDGGASQCGVWPDDSVWALALSGGQTWSNLEALGDPPGKRREHSAIYDPVRNQMIVFGGGRENSGDANDVWALWLTDHPTWVQISPQGTPPSPRHGHTAIYDAANNRMLVFGGESYQTWSFFSDVWELTLTGIPTWRCLSTSGNAPIPRAYSTAIYDPSRQRMLVFGGVGREYPFGPILYFNDVWELRLTDDLRWTNVSPSGDAPTPRYVHTAVYDHVRDRMVVFAGYGYQESLLDWLNDTWALSLAGTPQWTRLSPSGTEPGARLGHSAIYDPVRDRMVVFGGSGGRNRDDTAILNWGTPVPPGLSAVQIAAHVRAEHDDGPFVIPRPPLPGITTILSIGSHSWRRVTDAGGIATFPVAPNPNGQYEVRLTGPSYHIRVDFRYDLQVPDQDPPKQYLFMDPSNPTTSFEWPHGLALDHGTALQAAYFVERFRREFWRDRLGHEWTLPHRLGRSSDSMVVTIAEYDPGLAKKGGATVENATVGIRVLRHRGEESDILYHEYTHWVIADRFTVLLNSGRGAIGHADDSKDEGHAMDEALADYFAATFSNDPSIGRCPGSEQWPYDPVACREPLRTLANRMQYPTNYRYEQHHGSMILSGALWDLRRFVDGDAASVATITDPLVFAALDTMILRKRERSARYMFDDFYRAIRTVAAATSASLAHQVDLAFTLHNIPIGNTYTPIGWIDDVALKSAEPVGANAIRLAWTPLAHAASYRVLANAANLDPGTSLGSYWAVASDLTDTTYVFEARDSKTEYLFSVVGVDSLGQAGYEALPVYVAALDTAVVDVAEIPRTRAPHGRWLFNSPNPFNPETRIAFETVANDRVVVSVYDLRGSRIRELLAADLPAGRHTVSWNGLDSAGHRVASGQYVVLLRGRGWRDHGKILLVK